MISGIELNSRLGKKYAHHLKKVGQKAYCVEYADGFKCIMSEDEVKQIKDTLKKNGITGHHIITPYSQREP